MKILILSPYFPPEGGGLERYAETLAELLAEEHEVKVLTLSRSSMGIEKRGRLLVERVRARLVVPNTPLGLKFVLRAFKLTREWKPDLIIAHTPVPFAADVGALLSRLFGIPLVVFYHTVGLEKGSHLDFLAKFYSKTLEKVLLSSASLLVSVSPAVKEHLLGKGYVSVVVPPLPDEGLGEASESPCRNKKKVILFVGQLSRAYSFKNFDAVFDAFLDLSPKFPEWELWVVGGGDLVDKYERMAYALGIRNRVRFFGHVASRKRMAEIYTASSILVLPSRFESFGLVVFEGALFGVFPIVSDTVARNFRVCPLIPLRVVRQRSELPSVLNEIISSPKTLKKACITAWKRGKAQKALLKG